MPPDYEKVARPLGITGCMVVESVWTLDDNQWALDVAAKANVVTAIVGSIGSPGAAGFGDAVDRFAQNRLFRGIRLGGVPDISKAAVMTDLMHLADKDLVVDFNIPVGQLPALARMARAVRGLRVVVEHMAGLSNYKMLPADWMTGVQMAGQETNVYLKMSPGSPDTYKNNGTDLDTFRPAFDHVVASFGEDRVFFGTNWPVVDEMATTLALATKYWTAKGKPAMEKFFWQNSRTAYKWVLR
jgi:predicted TIM-barrel fold metal-dependent hydrolase